MDEPDEMEEGNINDDEDNRRLAAAEGAMMNEEEFIEFIAEQLVEWNVTHEELYGIVSIVHGDHNETVLRRGSPLSQPVVMRCMISHMDFDTLKNLRLSCKAMMTMADPYFYKRGTFKIKDSQEFYKFIKKANTDNNLIPQKMRRIEFSENIDLFEVSRIMYRSRSNLKELSVITTPLKLRGEFQNIAGILPVMEKLHTLRLHLPRRYLLHQLFRSTPLKTIKTLQFNFENAHPLTICGIFNACVSLEYVEMLQEQVKHIGKLAVAPVELKPCKSKASTHLKIFKVTPKKDARKVK